MLPPLKFNTYHLHWHSNAEGCSSHTFLFFLTGTVITSNITDNTLCPGEGVAYTCVSQGNTQRWRIENEGDTVPTELVYTRVEEPGSISTKSPYVFTLVSTDYSHFESTVAVVITMSLHNTVLECTGATLRDSVKVQIAGDRSSGWALIERLV